MNEVELSDLELEIITDLAGYGNLKGKAFWLEVERLLAFGEDWAEHI